MELIKKLIKDEEGQGLVEYALIIALVAIVIAAVALPGLTTGISTVFDNIVDALN